MLRPARAQNRLLHDAAYAGATVLAVKMEEKLAPECEKATLINASASAGLASRIRARKRRLMGAALSVADSIRCRMTKNGD
jgi:hypothetical protein